MHWVDVMDVRQFQYFLAVVDFGGFTKAAAELYISQSAISQAVHALECDLGVQLFHRAGRAAVLTDAGRALIPSVRQVVQACAFVTETAGDITGVQVGEVRLITQESPGAGLLAELIRRYHALYRNIHLSVVAARRPEDALNAVSSGRCDLGLATFAERPYGSAVEAYRCSPDEIVLISPPSQCVAPAGTRVTAENLDGLPMILGQAGTRMRELAERLRAQGVSFHEIADVELRGTLISLVLAGVGHALVPEAWGRIAERLGAHIAYLSPPAPMPMWVVARRGRRTPSVEAFLDIARHSLDIAPHADVTTSAASGR